MPSAPQYFPNCYVCGSENPEGLHVPFEQAPGGCRAEYLARPAHVGWPEIIHGGLLFTLMDEAVAWAAIYAGRHAVTGKVEARFRAPVRVGARLVVIGRLIESSRRVLKAHAEIRQDDDAGAVVCEMDALMAVADVDRIAGEDSHGCQG